MSNPLERLCAEAEENDQVSLLLGPYDLKDEARSSDLWVFTGILQRSTRKGVEPVEFMVEFQTNNTSAYFALCVEDGYAAPFGLASLPEDRAFVHDYVRNGNASRLLNLVRPSS